MYVTNRAMVESYRKCAHMHAKEVKEVCGVQVGFKPTANNAR